VVQGDAFNRSRIMTTICVILTSNLRLADVPGNVMLPARSTGLPKDSVANVSQIVTLDRRDLGSAVGNVARRQIERVLAGIDLVFDRERAHRTRA